MKLLFVLSEYLPETGGGIISYYAGVLPHLVSAGHTVDVLVASMEFLNHPECLLEGVQVSYLKTEFLNKFQVGFERYRLKYPTFAAFLPVAWAAYEQARHGAGYDLVETTDFPLFFAPWVVSTDSPPAVVSLHGSCGQIDWYGYPERNSIDGDFLRLVERASVAQVSAVYTNSEMNAQFWESTARRSIPILLPAHFKIDDIAHREMKKSCHGVVVGRFQKWKGPHVLCDALKQLPRENVRWIGRDIIDQGTGIEHSASLKNEFSEILGTQLILEGSMSREDTLRKIAEASYLCVPSEWDVFNLTVVEAMAQGTLVICSNRAGASMLIEHGVNGFLFDPENPKELAMLIQRVRSLDETERNSITEEARATVENRLNSDALAQERISYYRGVVASSLGWKVDEWLRLALAPRQESDKQTHQLLSYSVYELIEATGVQILAGLKRRFK